VANTFEVISQGAVGFIGWLGFFWWVETLLDSPGGCSPSISDAEAGRIQRPHLRPVVHQPNRVGECRFPSAFCLSYSTRHTSQAVLVVDSSQ